MSDEYLPAESADQPPANGGPGSGTDRPEGSATAEGRSASLRSVLITCGVLCMLVGPASCYSSVSVSFTAATNGEGTGSDASGALILGVAVSVGVPIAMAVAAARRRDFKAAGWSAALLAWPVVVTAAVLLFFGLGS